jgi:membrane-associated phospholipid phosphatase
MDVSQINQKVKSIINAWQTRYGSILYLFSSVWVAGLVTTILALWGFLELADEVLEKQTKAIDAAILQLVIHWRNPVLNNVMHGFSAIGGIGIVTGLCLVVLIWLWCKHHWSTLKTFAVVAIGGTLINLAIKQFFERDRPDIKNLVGGNPRTSSFPSGHAMLSFVIYGFVTYLLASRYEKYRGWIITGFVLLTIGIGISRLYLGIHWFTDVVAGYTAGMTWLFTCILSWELRLGYRHLKRLKSSS